MNDCKYCGGNCPEQVDKNGEARAEFICDGYELYRERNRPIMESTITTIFKGEYVQVDLVDETIELTVENNVYSRSESTELLIELTTACAVSKTAKSVQDEYLSHYPNHLPRLIKEIKDRRYKRENEDE